MDGQIDGYRQTDVTECLQTDVTDCLQIQMISGISDLP